MNGSLAYTPVSTTLIERNFGTARGKMLEFLADNFEEKCSGTIFVHNVIKYMLSRNTHGKSPTNAFLTDLGYKVGCCQLLAQLVGAHALAPRRVPAVAKLVHGILVGRHLASRRGGCAQAGFER